MTKTCTRQTHGAPQGIARAMRQLCVTAGRIRMDDVITRAEIMSNTYENLDEGSFRMEVKMT